MQRIKQCLKEYLLNPKYGAKVIAVVLIIVVMLMPQNHTHNNENQDKETTETSSSYEQSSSSEEEEEENSSEYEFHIGTTNLIALAGGIIALAVVKNKERRFLNNHDKK